MPAQGGNHNFWTLVGQYTALAFLLPSATFAGYICGHLLDRWLGTKFLTVVFLILGIAAGFVQFIRQVQKDSHRADG
jgi:F0F1-type ATP synthase assembly protein I